MKIKIFEPRAVINGNFIHGYSWDGAEKDLALNKGRLDPYFSKEEIVAIEKDLIDGCLQVLQVVGLPKEVLGALADIVMFNDEITADCRLPHPKSVAHEDAAPKVFIETDAGKRYFLHEGQTREAFQWMRTRLGTKIEGRKENQKVEQHKKKRDEAFSQVEGNRYFLLAFDRHQQLKKYEGGPRQENPEEFFLKQIFNCDVHGYDDIVKGIQEETYEFLNL